MPWMSFWKGALRPNREISTPPSWSQNSRTWSEQQVTDLNARPMARAATFASLRFIAIVWLLSNCVRAMHFFIEVLTANLTATGSDNGG